MQRVLGWGVLAGILVSLLAVAAGWTTFSVAAGVVTVAGAGAWAVLSVRRPTEVTAARPDLNLRVLQAWANDSGNVPAPRQEVHIDLELFNSGDGPASLWRVVITSPRNPGMPGQIRSKSGSTARWHGRAGEDERELDSGQLRSTLWYVNEGDVVLPHQDLRLGAGFWATLPEGQPVEARYDLMAKDMEPKWGTLIVRHLGGANARVEIRPDS